MNTGIILSSFISGLLSAMGFGGGTFLIICLTQMQGLEQKEAQGINLVFFVVTGLFAVYKNIRKGLVDKNSLFQLLKFSLPGLIVGFILLNTIPTQMLKKIFGGALLILGLKSLFEKDKAKTPPKNDPL